MEVVWAEIEIDTKSAAEKLLASAGLDPAQAIRMFYDEIVARNGLPFQETIREKKAVDRASTEPLKEFYPEYLAAHMPSVRVELCEAAGHGSEMLQKLIELREKRAAKKKKRKKAVKAEPSVLVA